MKLIDGQYDVVYMDRTSRIIKTSDNRYFMDLTIGGTPHDDTDQMMEMYQQDFHTVSREDIVPVTPKFPEIRIHI